MSIYDNNANTDVLDLSGNGQGVALYVQPLAISPFGRLFLGADTAALARTTLDLDLRLPKFPEDFDATGADGSSITTGPNAVVLADDHIPLQNWLDSGGALFFPWKVYYSSGDLYVRKGMTLRGAGYVFDAIHGDIQGILGARIKFGPGAGWKVEGQTHLTDVAAVIADLAAAFTQEGAMNSHFDDFALIGAGTGAPTVGWKQRTVCFGNNVYITNFTSHAIHITSTSDIPNADDEYGSTSGSRLASFHAIANGGDAFKIQGRDAGTSSFPNFEARSNLGWGINSTEEYGCHWNKPNVQGNGNAIKMSVGTIVTPYIEPGSGSACQIGGNVTIIGSDLTSVNTPPDAAPVSINPSMSILHQLKFNWNYFTGAALIGSDFGYLGGDAVYGLVIQGKGGAGDIGFFNRNAQATAFVTGASKDWNFNGNVNLPNSANPKVVFDGSSYGEVVFREASANAASLLATGSAIYYSADTAHYFRDNTTRTDFRVDIDSSGLNIRSGKKIRYNGADLIVNGTLLPTVQTVSSAATVTPVFTNDQVNITAQAAALQLLNPTGTAIPAKRIRIRIKDNGTARAITYDTQYRAIGVTLPTTTVINKTMYLTMIFNSTDTKWDVIDVKQEV